MLHRTMKDLDRKCNVIQRQMAEIKGRGDDTGKGTEYERLVCMLQGLCRERLDIPLGQ